MSKELKEYNISFKRLDNSNDTNRNLGLRSKLGGKPNWIQYDETPQCVACKSEMVFVLQLDSIEHQSKLNSNSIDAMSNEQEYMFGDVGIIYTFFCFKCGIVESVWQC